MNDNMRQDAGKTIFNVCKKILKTKSIRNISAIIIWTENVNSAQLLQKISAIIIYFCSIAAENFCNNSIYRNLISAQSLQKMFCKNNMPISFFHTCLDADKKFFCELTLYRKCSKRIFCVRIQ